MTDAQRQELTGNLIRLGVAAEYLESLSAEEFERYCYEPGSRPHPIRVRRKGPDNAMTVGILGALQPPPEWN